MEENEKLKALHESLLKDNYELPSYDIFAEDMRSPDKSKAFYDGLMQDNYELPDYEVFVNDLGLKKKDIYESLGFGRDLVKELYGEESPDGSKESAPEVSKKPPDSELPALADEVDFNKTKAPNLSLKQTDGKFSFPNNDFNDSLARAMLNVPVKEDEPESKTIDYITALPQGFNQRMGQAIRNIGAVVNAPKEALAKGVQKIAGKAGSANEQYLRQAFSALPILGSFDEESMDQLATAVETAGKPGAIPNDLIGKTLGATGSIMFDIMSVRTAPIPKLNALAKYGMERVPMFPTYLAVMEGTTVAREGGTAGETVMATAEGAASGLTYEGMGVAGGRVGKLVKELGAGQTLSTTSRALANSVLFGADSKLKGGTFMEGAAIGFVFGGYDLATEGISRSIAHRAYVSYLTATDNNIKTISKMQVDPMKMRKQSDELWEQYEQEKDPTVKKVLLEEKTEVDNIININAMTQEILKNPKAFKDAVMKDERLSPKEKALWVKKFDTTVKDADPRLAEAEPIVADIKQKEGELAYWQENETADPKIKEAKVESVTTQIEEQNKALQNTLAKPLEDYAPKKEKGKGAEEKPKEEDVSIKDKPTIYTNQINEKFMEGKQVGDVVYFSDDPNYFKTNKGNTFEAKINSSNTVDLRELQKELGREYDKEELTNYEIHDDLIQAIKGKGKSSVFNTIVRDAFNKGGDKLADDVIRRLKNADIIIGTESTFSEKPITTYAVINPKSIEGVQNISRKTQVKSESKLAVGEKQFKTKEDLNTYLEDIAVNKKTGEVDETWFDREINAWPTPETVKAINEWTENKKAEIKAKRPKVAEEPIETGLVKTPQKELTKNDLIDEIRRFNILSAAGKRKAGLQANTIRVNAKRLGYELKEGVDEWKVGITQDGKFLALKKDPTKVDKQRVESQKLLTERDKDFQDYVNDVMETNPDLFGVLIGGLSSEQKAQAFRDIKEGKKSTASATALNELERMYKESGGIDIWNAEGKMRVGISREEIRAEVDDMKRRKRDELFNTYNLDEAIDKGLITKTEYDEIRESERKQDLESRAAEEDFYRNEAGDIEGGKEKGTEGGVGYQTKNTAPKGIKQRFADVELKPDGQKFISTVPKTEVRTLDSGEKVMEVDGTYIRDNIYPDWTMGGNEGAYPSFVPKGEIWIDRDMNPKEKEATIIHEQTERKLMLEKDMTYDDAHVKALEAETKFRETNKIVNEQPVKQPDITTGKEGEDIVQSGTEKDVAGVEGKGTKEPVSEPAKVETPATNTLNDAVSKYGWSAVKNPEGFWLLNPKGTAVVKVKIKKGTYQFFDTADKKLMDGRGQLEKSAEKLLKDYYYAKEAKPEVVKEMPSEKEIQDIAVSLKNDDRNSAKKNTVVKLDMKLADEAFQRDKDYYIGKGDKGIGNRREQVRKLIADGKLNIAPLASIIINKEGKPVLSFTDGRHRFAELRDLGAKEINLSVDPSSLKYVDQLRKEPTIRNLPTTKDKITFTRGGREWTSEVLHVYPDGRVDVDVFGRKTINPEEYTIVGENVKTETPQQGIKFKDKNYTDIEQVQDDLAEGKITFDESKQLMEDVRKFEDNLKAEASQKAASIGEKMNKNINNAEGEINKSVEDQGKLFMRLVPPDVISQGNTALWKQLVKVRDGVSNWIAGKLQEGMGSQTDAARWTSKAITNWYGGLGRTQRDIMGKLKMTGTVKEFAPMEAGEIRDKLLKVVNSDPESLRRVRDALDPEIATEQLVYGDLTPSEKNLYFQSRDLNTWIHETTYSDEFIPTETYLKFKDVTGDSKYIARLYDKYEIMPEEISEFIKQGNNSVQTKIMADIFKARSEVDEWKKEHAITDPTYLTAKRVMQTIQNHAVKEYMDQVIADHPNLVKTLKKGEALPKGFTKLSSSYKWGPFRNKAVANHIVEDFTGFFFANEVLNVTYDAMKMFDRTGLNQFYKKFRTVYNPFVQTGNFTGNMFFSSIAGVNPATLVSTMPSAIRDMNAKTPEYKSVLKAGILGKTSLTVDMSPVLVKDAIPNAGTVQAETILDKARGMFEKMDKAATDLYQGSDNVAKYAAYKIFRGQGLSHEQSVRRVYDAYQNYSTVGKIWDVASKTPLLGNKFVKFQADLQRILLNSATTSPLTTIGTLALISVAGKMVSALSGETEEEQKIRESRKGVAKIPLPFGMSVPLSFKAGKMEINVARYLAPLYIYKYEDSDADLAELSKFLPFQLQKVDRPALNETGYVPSFSDPTYGFLASIIADRDFRGISIQNPKASKYHNPNPTTEERIANVMNYVGRTQVPFYRSTQDLYDGITGNLDYYGRKRDWKQAILNNIIKVQEFDKPELKSYVERNIDYLTNRFVSLSARMGDSNASFFKALKQAQDQELPPDVIAKIYETQDKVRSKRLQKSLDEQVTVMQELERMTGVYKKWYPDDPFIEENFMNIQQGKNQRFNVMDDIDMQKKYKDEYMLLKSNKMLRRPSVPSYLNGIQLTEQQRKDYLNTYWSEYIRQIDMMVGLTAEEFEEEKGLIIKEEPSETTPMPKRTSLLDAKASSAAETAKAIAEMQLRMNQTK